LTPGLATGDFPVIGMHLNTSLGSRISADESELAESIHPNRREHLT